MGTGIRTDVSLYDLSAVLVLPGSLCPTVSIYWEDAISVVGVLVLLYSTVPMIVRHGGFGCFSRVVSLSASAACLE